MGLHHRRATGRSEYGYVAIARDSAARRSARVELIVPTGFSATALLMAMSDWSERSW